MLGVNETHTTSQGEPVEENYMWRSKELCRHCKESLEAWFGSSLGLLGEEALMQLKQQRDAEYGEAPAAPAQGYVSDVPDTAHP
jgi:hypothetical protein